MRRTVVSFLVVMPLLAALPGCGPSESADGLTAQRLSLLARDILHRQEVVSVEDLSDWIIKGKQDFVLIDVRSQKAFAAGNIQGAKSIPLTYLVEEPTLQGLPGNRLLVLYSADTREAAQATAVLRLMGRHAYFLEGGYQAWEDRILHPQVVGPDAGDSRARKRAAVACYFAPNYKTESGSEFSPALLPLVPAPPGATSQDGTELFPPIRRPRKKKHKGC